ncbi:MAG TPA: tRNA (cytidine(34)-2'-O)-methyltransferase [Rhodanobacteraceae bacterium]|nr:tRNA (cytidine(34)-2'-O)-methyltransferase [Rhodanobacteraceae bacterium]
MLHVILHRPEIPANTGNAMRLCANAGAALHLVRPLGFELDDKRLRRAGLDYREYARVTVHEDLEACLATLGRPRTFAFSRNANHRYSDARFADGDALVFGCESSGLDAAALERVPTSQRLCLPMQPDNRSLNLSNAVAIAVYEAWRQLGFGGAA